jgi:hypothetical protein
MSLAQQLKQETWSGFHVRFMWWDLLRVTHSCPLNLHNCCAGICLMRLKDLDFKFAAYKKNKQTNKEILKTRSASINTKHQRIRFKDKNDSSL